MRIYKPPKIFKKIFSDLTWEIPCNNNIYLTFDDGPTPFITENILEILEKFNAKATFFCIGKNVENNSNIFKGIINHGHSVGNHTYNHMNGWKTKNYNYFKDIEHADKLIKSSLFRPPYGQIKPSQINYLKNHYNIVMWDIISYDFDKNLSWRDVYKIVVNKANQGSIINFHDSIKASERVLKTLPEILKNLSDRNFVFKSINMNK